MNTYSQIGQTELTSNIRWELPASEGGQIIQTEQSSNHDVWRVVNGKPRCLPIYKRQTDRSNNTVSYWKLVSIGVELEMRCKAFSLEPLGKYRVKVDDVTGTVRVYDSIAGHYTTCHALSKSAECRARKLACPVQL